jgi:Na+-driven multidrug efflux pump
VLPLLAFDKGALGLFLPDDSGAVELARHLDRIVVGSFLLFGVTFVLSGVVRATGAVLPPLIILALALWGVRVPLAVLLQPRFGLDAVWWSFPASATAAMLMSLAYYRWGGWRRARMLPVDTDAVAVPAEVPAAVPSPVADVAPHAPPGPPDDDEDGLGNLATA